MTPALYIPVGIAAVIAAGLFCDRVRTTAIGVAVAAAVAAAVDTVALLVDRSPRLARVAWTLGLVSEDDLGGEA